jgi:hypothetical protein
MTWRAVPRTEYGCLEAVAKQLKKRSNGRRSRPKGRSEQHMGLPTGKQKWVKLSLRTIASSLREQAYKIGRTTVGRLLRKLDFGLVANRKSLTEPRHPDRDRQFRYIRRVQQRFLEAGLPVIRVDTKHKELIGNFANKGRTWRQTPEQVNGHDFPSDALGRAVPYVVSMTSLTIKVPTMWATPTTRRSLPYTPLPSGGVPQNSLASSGRTCY